MEMSIAAGERGGGAAASYIFVSLLPHVLCLGCVLHGASGIGRQCQSKLMSSIARYLLVICYRQLQIVGVWVSSVVVTFFQLVKSQTVETCRQQVYFHCTIFLLSEISRVRKNFNFFSTLKILNFHYEDKSSNALWGNNYSYVLDAKHINKHCLKNVILYVIKNMLQTQQQQLRFEQNKMHLHKCVFLQFQL